MKIGIKKPLILTTLISITLLSGCGGGGAMSDADKVIIEKAMVSAEEDWGSRKEVMIMLVELKGSGKAEVKADFEEYFSLAEEFTGESGLKLQRAINSGLASALQRVARNAPGSKLRADTEAEVEEWKKKAKEADAKQEERKAKILEVQKRIKSRYQ